MVKTTETTSVPDNEPYSVMDNSNTPDSTESSLSAKNSNVSESTETSLSSENSIAPEDAESSLSPEGGSNTTKSDNLLSEESDSSDEKTAVPAENSVAPESNNGRSLPIIIGAICGAIVIAAGAVFVIIRKVRK